MKIPLACTHEGVPNSSDLGGREYQRECNGSNGGNQNEGKRRIMLPGLLNFFKGVLVARDNNRFLGGEGRRVLAGLVGGATVFPLHNIPPEDHVMPRIEFGSTQNDGRPLKTFPNLMLQKKGVRSWICACVAGSNTMASEKSQEGRRDPQSRSLKIEVDGDRWDGYKPKIRLSGLWLERAGFKPGERVQVNLVRPGVLEICSQSMATFSPATQVIQGQFSF